MIHQTYECDRCHTKEAETEAKSKRWECVWREFEIAVPVHPRQGQKPVTVLCCPRCADFMETIFGRVVTDASKDAVMRELFK